MRCRRGPGARRSGLALKRRRDTANRLILEAIAQRRAEPQRNDAADALSLLVAARDERGRPLPDAHTRDQLILNAPRTTTPWQTSRR